MALLGRFLQPPAASHFLFGPRGTGKSTFLRQAFPDAPWVDLLRPEVHQRFAARPERLVDLVDGNPEADVVVLDEVQRVPVLLDVVHHLIERPGPTKAPRFILTGSSSRKLRRTGVNLLAGRLLLERMHPFMAGELPSFNLDVALRRGLLPVVWDSDTPDATLASYVALYIREEVQAEGLVRRLDNFARFVEVVSFSHGSVLNLAEVAREAHTSRKTAESYLGILEDLYLAFRLPVFRRRAKRQLSGHPKFYWFDAGVFRSVRPAGPFDRPEEIDGGALEGLVAQHLRAWIDYSHRNAALYYWRTKSGSEVDFIVYGEAGLSAFQVQNSARVRNRDLRGLRAFLEDYPEAQARLLYRGTERLEIQGIRCEPCGPYLAGIRPGRPLPDDLPDQKIAPPAPNGITKESRGTGKVKRTTDKQLVEYANRMQEIVRRTKALAHFRQVSAVGLPWMMVVEVHYLQLRHILELIATALLVVNKTAVEESGSSDMQSWRALRILDAIEAVNPDFYPEPSKQGEKDADGVRHSQPVGGGFLTREHFTTLYRICGSILHTRNPFTRKTHVERTSKGDCQRLLQQADEWQARIVRLLTHHDFRIKDDDTLYLAHTVGPDHEFQVVEFVPFHGAPHDQ